VTTLDSQRGDVAVVVAAGGAGLRLGPGDPKALRLLAGVPLLLHALRGVAAAGCAGYIVIAAPPGHRAAVRELLARLGPADSELLVVSGGHQRRESVAAALAAIPAGPGVVLVHDAARALTPASLVAQVAAAVRAGHDAVIPVLPVTDTIVQVGTGGEVTGQLDRAVLRAVQTPQGFRREVLAAAHRAADGASATDDAGLVARLGVPVHTIPGSRHAMKITTPHDLVIAEALLGATAGRGPTRPL
jgi:2-C-methyl-D-erythritol 4-phosphate cytidylyltransferase